MGIREILGIGRKDSSYLNDVFGNGELLTGNNKEKPSSVFFDPLDDATTTPEPEPRVSNKRTPKLNRGDIRRKIVKFANDPKKMGKFTIALTIFCAITLGALYKYDDIDDAIRSFKHRKLSDGSSSSPSTAPAPSVKPEPVAENKTAADTSQKAKTENTADSVRTEQKTEVASAEVKQKTAPEQTKEKQTVPSTPKTTVQPVIQPVVKPAEKLTGKAAETPAKKSVHTINRGDTLWGIVNKELRNLLGDKMNLMSSKELEELRRSCMQAVCEDKSNPEYLDWKPGKCCQRLDIGDEICLDAVKTVLESSTKKLDKAA